MLDGEAVTRWLEQPNTRLEDYYKDLQVSPAALAVGGLESIEIKIHPQAPFLINDPGYVLPKENSEDTAPDLQYSRTADGKKALIPGRSLKGLLRARARRILATMLTEKTVDCSKAVSAAEELIKELFGRDQKRGTVWVSDAVVEGSSVEHPQMFNAVDRFTGGVAHGKLYSVVATECDTLKCTVVLDSQRAPLQDWCKGLLLLVIRDAFEGDLPIGWGKARGYGAFRISLTIENQRIENWPQFLDWLKNSGRHDAQKWIDSLDTEIQETAADLPAGEKRHAV